MNTIEIAAAIIGGIIILAGFIYGIYDAFSNNKKSDK